MLAFSEYGENAIIIVQNVVVILLIYNYDKTISLVEKLLFVALISTYATWLLMDTNVPEEAWPFVTSSCILCNCASRMPQIYSNFSNKSTGVLSFITFFLGWAGSTARFIGVLFASDDIMFISQFAISAFLNTTIIAQFGLYWNSEGAKKDKKVEIELKDTKKTR